VTLDLRFKGFFALLITIGSGVVATNIVLTYHDAAVVQGNVVSIPLRLQTTAPESNADVIVYWDSEDHGTNKYNWPQYKRLNDQPVGVINSTVNIWYVSRTNYLRGYATNTAGDTWTPQSLVFTTLFYFTEDEVENMGTQHDVDLLNNLTNYFPGQDGIAAVEEFIVDQLSQTNIVTWSDWTNRYNAHIYPDPIVIALDDNPVTDLSTPEKAAEFWMQTFYGRNSSNLFLYSDESGTNLLSAFGFSTTNYSQGFWDPQTNLTKATILLSARKHIIENDYVSIFYRIEHDQSPSTSNILFKSVTLKSNAAGYVHTDDINGSAIDHMLYYITTNFVHAGRYTNVQQVFTNTAMPTHFYTIE